ncbi:LicD family protein, partial [Methylobacterium frigidaeris]
MQLLDITKAVCDVIDATDPASDDFQVAKLALELKLGLIQVVETEIASSSDKDIAWTRVQRAVKIAFGEGYVLTQHGVSKSLGASLSPTRQAKVVSGVSNFLDRLTFACGLSCFLTSGTLLGIIRDGQLIAHDDDIDSACICNSSDNFNWALEWNHVFNVINKSGVAKAERHLPGLLHVTIQLDSGDTFRFDLFAARIENDSFIEYPLNVNLIKKI